MLERLEKRGVWESRSERLWGCIKISLGRAVNGNRVALLLKVTW